MQPTDFPDEVNIELLDPTSASETPELLPLTTTISDIYPNPFNSRTTISFVLTAPGEIELSLFDLLGREISVLANGGYSAGSHQIHLNADQLPSGFYFVHLQAGEASAARRMLLVK